MWGTSSQHFSAPSLTTPAVTGFQQLHDIHGINWNLKFIPCIHCGFWSRCHFLSIDSSQALINSSQAGFARREMTLQGIMRSRNFSIYKRSWVSYFFKTWDINPSLASAQRLQEGQGTENRWRIISSKGTPWTGYPSGEQQNHHPKWEIQWFVG